MRTMFGLGLLAAVALVTGAGARAALLDAHEGPHKGIVVEWGEEEYHPEIVIDKKEGTVAVYVHGGERDLEKGKTTAIDAKALVLTLKTDPATTIKLEPAPADDKDRKDDPKDKSSKFVGKSEVLKKDMKWAGTLAGKVGTKPYSGDFKQK